MALVNMSVYATKEVGIGPDGVHRLIDYAIRVRDPADPNQGVVISETNRERRFSLPFKQGIQFQFAVWTIDENVDPEQSWMRCTFRPAHDVGVCDVTSPLTPPDTQRVLKGLSLCQATSNTNVDWEEWGMLERQYTGIWWSAENLALQNQGKFEIAVQVGLHYTDGTPPAYCMVDPEMDLDPG